MEKKHKPFRHSQGAAVLKGDSKEGTQVDAITTTYGYNASWLAARESRKPDEPNLNGPHPIEPLAQPNRLLSRARLGHVEEEPVISEVMRQKIGRASCRERV